jgi:hypothetical protein
LLSAFPIFVATIFKGIFVSSIFLSPKTSSNFFSNLFHFKSPDLKSKSAKDKIFIDFAKSFISQALIQIAYILAIIAPIEVPEISSTFIFFSSRYFNTQICINPLAAQPHRASEIFFIVFLLIFKISIKD